MDKFCPRCLCQHETRSVTTIKVVVIIILWVVSLLICYLAYLVCLDPVLRPGAGSNYQQHQDEVSLTEESGVTAGPLPLSSLAPRSVVNRVRSDQQRWQRQVGLHSCRTDWTGTLVCQITQLSKSNLL